MSLPFMNTQLTLVLVALFLVIAFVVGLYLKRRKDRSLALRTRFGSEYDLAVREHRSTQKAEEKLAGRETRVETLNIRDLGALEQERFIAEWQAVQARFVDHPKIAVTEASDLINTILLARGYPQAGFEQRAADVSVTYPKVMESYRIANSIAVRSGRADASTEELRTAMIRYRAIFDELIQAQRPLAKKSAA